LFRPFCGWSPGVTTAVGVGAGPGDSDAAGLGVVSACATISGGRETLQLWPRISPRAAVAESTASGV
jgi:hypothetical protein